MNRGIHSARGAEAAGALALIVAQGAAIATFAVSLRALARRLDRLEQRMDEKTSPTKEAAPRHTSRVGLRRGSIAPRFSLPRRGGGRIALDDLPGQRALLIFGAHDCGPCHQLAHEIAHAPAAAGWDSTVIIASGNSVPDEWPEGIEVAFDSDRAVTDAYGIEHPPAIAIVSPEGKILVSAAARGRDDVERLARARG